MSSKQSYKSCCQCRIEDLEGILLIKVFTGTTSSKCCGRFHSYLIKQDDISHLQPYLQLHFSHL